MNSEIPTPPDGQEWRVSGKNMENEFEAGFM